MDHKLVFSIGIRKLAYIDHYEYIGRHNLVSKLLINCVYIDSSILRPRANAVSGLKCFFHFRQICKNNLETLPTGLFGLWSESAEDELGAVELVIFGGSELPEKTNTISRGALNLSRDFAIQPAPIELLDIEEH